MVFFFFLNKFWGGVFLSFFQQKELGKFLDINIIKIKFIFKKNWSYQWPSPNTYLSICIGVVEDNFRQMVNDTTKISL